MENELDWQRVGAAVRARRGELGLRQEDISVAGGPSHHTLRRLESGDPGPYQPRTLAKLEDTLQWRRGTVAGIRDGTAGDNPSEWVVVHHFRTVEDSAPASDRVVPIPDWIRPRAGTTAMALAAHATGTGTGTVNNATPADPVAAISNAAWTFYGLVQEHDADAPATREVRQAIVNYLHDLYVRDLSKDD